MINEATLIGNLGQDPELRSTANGSAVCNLSVATTHRVKRGDTYEDQTEWHRVVCFGRTAENAANYLSKGRQVYIKGRIQTRKWQDKTGADRYSTEIVAFEVKFLGSKGDSGGQSSGGGGYSGPKRTARGSTAPHASDAQGGGYGGGGDDIPFDVPVLL